MIAPDDEADIMATLSAIMNTLPLIMRRMRSIERRLTILAVVAIIFFIAVLAFVYGQAVR